MALSRGGSSAATLGHGVIKLRRAHFGSESYFYTISYLQKTQTRIKSELVQIYGPGARPCFVWVHSKDLLQQVTRGTEDLLVFQPGSLCNQFIYMTNEMT